MSDQATFTSDAAPGTIDSAVSTTASDASAAPTSSAPSSPDASESLTPESNSDYKFKSWEEAEKGYKEVQSHKDKQMNELKDTHASDLEKYKAFTGAPEDGYTYQPSEDLAESGFTFDEKNELFGKAKEMAQSMGLNQEAFSGFMDLYAQDMHASTSAFATEMHDMASDQVEQDLASMSHEERSRFVPLLNQAAQLEGVNDAGLNDLVDNAGAEGLKALMSIISARASGMPMQVSSYNDTPDSLRKAMATARTPMEKEEVNRRYAAHYQGVTLNTQYSMR